MKNKNNLVPKLCHLCHFCATSKTKTAQNFAYISIENPICATCAGNFHTILVNEILLKLSHLLCTKKSGTNGTEKNKITNIGVKEQKICAETLFKTAQERHKRHRNGTDSMKSGIRLNKFKGVPANLPQALLCFLCFGRGILTTHRHTMKQSFNTYRTPLINRRDPRNRYINVVLEQCRYILNSLYIKFILILKFKSNVSVALLKKLRSN